jgi:hypothetical protein
MWFGGFERGWLFFLMSGSLYYILCLSQSVAYVWCWGLYWFQCEIVCLIVVRGCCGIVGSGWRVVVVVCVRVWAVAVVWVGLGVCLACI